jgi:hypothetical protein
MRVSLIAATVLLCACASGGNSSGSEPPDLRATSQYTRVELPSGAPIEIDWEHQHTYQETTLLVGVDKAWAAYPAVFGELGIEPGIVDSKQHVYGNAGIKMRNSLGRLRLSKYFDCGTTAGMSNADTYDVLVRVVSQVLAADAGVSTLRTQVEATAHANAVSGATVRCVSTGALEERIAHMLSEMTAKPNAS